MVIIRSVGEAYVAQCAGFPHRSGSSFEGGFACRSALLFFALGCVDRADRHSANRLPHRIEDHKFPFA